MGKSKYFCHKCNSNHFYNTNIGREHQKIQYFNPTIIVKIKPTKNTEIRIGDTIKDNKGDIYKASNNGKGIQSIIWKNIENGSTQFFVLTDVNPEYKIVRKLK